MLRAGKLNTLISILRLEEVQAGGGQVVGQWVEHAKVWADVKFPSGLGTIKADTDVSLVRASMRIRFREDIRSDMRVAVSGGRCTTSRRFCPIWPAANTLIWFASPFRERCLEAHIRDGW